MSIFLLILGLLLFIGLVVAHEWGHFIMARRNGVEVEEFGIFFPPRLFKHKTKGGWIFTINLLPLGGFVKLKGEHDADTVKGSFGAASLMAKSKIMAAGVVVNLIIAILLLTVLGWVGMPKLLTSNQFTVKSDTKVIRNDTLITNVESGSPAAKAGLKPNDKLTAIGLPGKPPVEVTGADALPGLTKRFAGQTVQVTYQRHGVTKTTEATLLSGQEVIASKATFNKQIDQTKLDCASIDPPKGYLGITPTEYTLQRSTWSAPVMAVGFSAQVTALTFQGLGHAVGGVGSAVAGLFSGNSVARQNGQCAAASQVSGPVGIYVILQDGSLLGYQFVLLIIGIISLTLAIMNILPIPALDGGRLWITLFTRGIKKPLSPRREEIINASGFVFLLALIAIITLVDIKRFF